MDNSSADCLNLLILKLIKYKQKINIDHYILGVDVSKAEDDGVSRLLDQFNPMQ
jgi:hypothetical protein